MTAPARNRSATRAVRAPQRDAETVEELDGPGGRRPRTAAAERAYARRAQREGRGRVRTRPVSAEEETPAGLAPFVLLVIALLAVGVASTLWLSTQAIADSYDLETARKAAAELAEQKEKLQQEVTKQESATALAEKARGMGMVPAGDSPRLKVGPDGEITLVGEPKPAKAPVPPAGPTVPDPATQTPAGQTPEGQTPAGQTTPAEGATPAAGQTQEGQSPQAGDAAVPPPAGGGG